MVRKPVNHTSWVAVVTPTERPKSVRNRCDIELFSGVLVCHFAFSASEFSVGIGDFVIGLNQISSFSSYLQNVRFIQGSRVFIMTSKFKTILFET